MRMRMGMAAAATAALLAAGLWTGVRAQSPPMAASIVLSMSGASCGKTLIGNDPNPANKEVIHAKRGNVVQWTVSNNNCAGTVVVRVDQFLRKSDGTPLSPFAGGNGQCSAAPGKTCVITLAVRQNADQVAYSYATFVAGVKVDPDLIIDP